MTGGREENPGDRWTPSRADGGEGGREIQKVEGPIHRQMEANKKGREGRARGEKISGVDGEPDKWKWEEGKE